MCVVILVVQKNRKINCHYNNIKMLTGITGILPLERSDAVLDINVHTV